ncbi:hypothetical protein GCM10011506_36830 [Marivirga lumbricoides]|uniref:Thymidylate kinase n=1 Tax=Marivirga lumbricoides TaxID=1046115 RepID=A0ABQ1MVZ6_9BACT|nr:hypothetical protein GCM10011506_36830 [Marivirga lumbricoides]
MQNIFKHIGYNVDNEASEAKELPIMMIKNPDGSARWIWHAQARKPYFLKFYNVSGLKPFAFATFCRIVFFLRIQRAIFSSKKVRLTHCDPSHPILNLFESSQWALFTGTTGPNNKMVIFHQGKEESEFIKIAPSNSANELLEKEFDTINILKNLKPITFSHPKAIRDAENILRLTDISYGGERLKHFSEEHKSTIFELSMKTTVNSDALRSQLLSEVSDKLHSDSLTQDQRIPVSLIEKLQELSQFCEALPFKMSFNHGDFTPWNMYSSVTGLNIYDWELADYLPIGFDAFHFIVQKGVMQEGKSWRKIKEEIDLYIPEELMNRWTKQSDLKRDDYLKLYLLVNATRYLYLYSQQEKWHAQISWLLAVWDDAITDLTKAEHANRGEFISNIFDYLQSKQYAAIKFPNIHPSLLSPNSDIDLCIYKNDYKSICQYIENHSAVKHTIMERKSFMASVKVFLHDNSIVCLDLIWKFKRKALVMMDAGEVLRNAVPNTYGVKNMSLKHLAEYLGLFYGLNAHEIPQFYQPYILALRDADTSIEKIIYKGLESSETPTEQLKAELLNYSPNIGIRKLYNHMAYAMDVTRELLFKRGLIITFSGVDGAGKSTIIEKTKYELEKKLRKRVVVLRHRPSVLPILSAWTKGKEKAEQDAANTLPRQGSNKSFISSLFRFGYYFVDYFFGQFYVKLKYVSRGYVVLYDRYYFDFINDSKRSNIHLPNKLLMLGYKFLFSPDLNFFLYAKPEVILERKKELDHDTINSLTISYLNLFGNLNKAKKGAYIPVENIAMDETLKTIMQQAWPKIA